MPHSATIHVTEVEDGCIEVSVHSDPALTDTTEPRSDLQHVVDRMILAAEVSKRAGMSVRIAER